MMTFFKHILTTMMFLCSIHCHAAIEIVFWHSMAGELGKLLNHIVTSFNNSQKEYEVVPLYKGTYTECLTNLAAAFRANKQPDIVQVLDIGTATMLNPQGIIVPLYELYQPHEMKQLNQLLFPTVYDYYADEKHRLLALPFNVSLPMVFYNKTVFSKHQINLENNETWEALESALSPLLDRKILQCGFTTTWPSWIHIEAFSVKHGVPFASNKNGFEGIDTQIQFNNEKMLFHLRKLKDWQAKKIFVYGGHTDDAQSLFTSQYCPILITSSGSYADLSKSVNFELGMMRLPYWNSLKTNAGQDLIGGGALWVMQTKNQNKKQGIKAFFNYILTSSVQSRWQCKSGYISPLKDDHMLQSEPCDPDIQARITILRRYFQNHSSPHIVRGIRLGNHIQIRMMNDKMLEAIWLGMKEPEFALLETVKTNNLILQRFYRSVS